MKSHRRTFLFSCAAAAPALALAGPLHALLMRTARAGGRTVSEGYGPLEEALDEHTGLPLLKLPRGFRYRSFGWTGEPMSDGHPTPADHDGMAVIAANHEGLLICRNHEVNGDAACTERAAVAYDERAPAGCTFLRFDPRSGKFTDSRWALSGTSVNCAGGPTPWATWLSCEETVNGPGDFCPVQNRPLEHQRDHGWVFEVTRDNSRPEPLKEMGRFWHEAVAVDPGTGIVYETEDRLTAGFYRFRPTRPRQLAAGGQLQMLCVRGYPDLRRNVPTGRPMDVEWVTIDEPLRAHTPGTSDTLGVYQQGAAQGGTTFARLEGCWFQDGIVYFAATNGGDAGLGQVWAYRPDQEQLHLAFESPDRNVLDSPDNITVSPRGGIVVCEDCDQPPLRMMAITPQGQIYTLAENNLVLPKGSPGFVGDYRAGEWAGVTFSPDGQWMFANIQHPGVTFAITGPWSDQLG